MQKKPTMDEKISEYVKRVKLLLVMNGADFSALTQTDVEAIDDVIRAVVTATILFEATDKINSALSNENSV